MTVRLGDYKSSSALAVMERISRIERTFTRADAEAMAEGVEVIARALMQPIGCARASAKGEGGGALVTAEEYDGAVVRVLCCAFMLVNSGKLMTGELFELDGGEGDD